MLKFTSFKNSKKKLKFRALKNSWHKTFINQHQSARQLSNNTKKIIQLEIHVCDMRVCITSGLFPESQLLPFNSNEFFPANSTSFPAFLLDEKIGKSPKQRMMERVLTTRLKSYTAEFIDLGEFFGKTRWTRARAIMSDREHAPMLPVAMETTRLRRDDVLVGEQVFFSRMRG